MPPEQARTWLRRATLKGWLALVLVVGAALTIVLERSCTRSGRSAPGAPPPGASSRLAPATAAIDLPRREPGGGIDGELTEASWLTAARTGPWCDPQTGAPSRPYSDARLLRDERNLYLGLYAADEDIRATVTEHDGPVWLDDSFSIRIADSRGRAWHIDVSAAGVLTDVRELPGGGIDKSWESGAVAAVDKDGTLNNASDDDEEWVVEMQLPLGAVCDKSPCGPLRMELSRCDTPRGEKRRCAGWKGVLGAMSYERRAHCGTP